MFDVARAQVQRGDAVDEEVLLGLTVSHWPGRDKGKALASTHRLLRDHPVWADRAHREKLGFDAVLLEALEGAFSAAKAHDAESTGFPAHVSHRLTDPTGNPRGMLCSGCWPHPCRRGSNSWRKIHISTTVAQFADLTAGESTR